MLEDLVNSVKDAVVSVKDYFITPGTVEGMRDYALKYYINEKHQNALFEGKSEQEKDKILSRLENRIQDNVGRSQKYLKKLSLNAGFLNGLYNFGDSTFNYLAKTPHKLFFKGYMFYVGTKAILELPALYKHVVETHDADAFYTVMEWGFAKALSGLIPIMGPLFDINVLQRNIKKHAIKDGAYNFLIEEGIISRKPSLYDRVKERVKSVSEQFGTGYEPKVA